MLLSEYHGESIIRIYLSYVSLTDGNRESINNRQSTIYYFPQNSNRKVNSILLYKENSRIWYYTLERHYDFVILSSRIPRASPSHRNTFSLFKIPKRKEEKYRIDMSQWTDLDLLRRTRHHLLVTDDISPTTWNLKLAKYKSNNRWKIRGSGTNNTPVQTRKKPKLFSIHVHLSSFR